MLSSYTQLAHDSGADLAQLYTGLSQCKWHRLHTGPSRCKWVTEIALLTLERFNAFYTFSKE